jgi:hypothetical protein
MSVIWHGYSMAILPVLCLLTFCASAAGGGGFHRGGGGGARLLPSDFQGRGRGLGGGLGLSLRGGGAAADWTTSDPGSEAPYRSKKAIKKKARKGADGKENAAEEEEVAGGSGLIGSVLQGLR